MMLNIYSMKDLENFKNVSSTFCMHPFTGLATREDGAIKPCCRSHPVGNME
jgi:hypothetical protein